MNDGAVFRAWTPLASVHKTIDNWHLAPPLPSPKKGKPLGFHPIGLKHLLTWPPHYDEVHHTW